MQFDINDRDSSVCLRLIIIISKVKKHLNLDNMKLCLKNASRMVGHQEKKNFRNNHILEVLKLFEEMIIIKWIGETKTHKQYYYK